MDEKHTDLWEVKHSDGRTLYLTTEEIKARYVLVKDPNDDETEKKPN